MTKRSKNDVALMVILSLFLGGACAWQIFEMDMFWMVRAGREIIENLSIPMKDTWTYTVNGEPWLNTHWLSELFVGMAHFIGGEAGLVLFRCITFMLLSLLYSAIVLQTCSAKSKSVLLTLLPLFFIMLLFRIRLRADTFVLLTYTATLWVWVSQYRLQHKRILTFVLILLAANFHAGSAIFTLLFALGLHFEPAQLKNRKFWGWNFLFLGAFVCSPIHFNAISFIIDHFFYSQGKVLGNPDHRPISIKHFENIYYFGYGFWIWAFMSVFGFLYYIKSKRPNTHPIFLLRNKWLGGSFFFVLTLMTLDRDRALMYQVSFALPIFCMMVEDTFVFLDKKLKIKSILSIAVIGFLWLVFYPYNLKVFPRKYGYETNAKVFPVRTVEFLKKSGFKDNIYHTYTFGAYIVWHLREHPIFGDTRETPFKKLEKLYFAAYGSAEVSKQLYEKYDINLILVPIPQTQFIPGSGFRDIISEYNDPKDWALVYFDDISIAVARRIPEHKNLIEANEFKYLKPNLPQTHYVHSKYRTAETDRIFLSEVERCLENEPHNVFCKSAKGVWLVANSSEPNDIRTAIKWYQEYLQVKPKDIHILVELMQAFQKIGDSQNAKAVEIQINLIYGSEVKS